MLPAETKRRQDELIKKIYFISKSELGEPEIRRLALELKEIYKGDFKHSYSEFFPVIVQVSREKDGKLDYISENLESLRKYVEDDFIRGVKEFESMSTDLYRLCDNLNLEIARFLYYSQNESKLSDLNVSIKKMNSELNSATFSLNEATEKANGLQTEILTVLSIFSAIVITFSSGINVIGNTISGIENANIFKLILAILLCGFILFNTIFLLMYFVSKITGKSIYARCMSPNCTCGENEAPKCKPLTRLKKRLPYVYYFNLTVILGIIADSILWNINILIRP